jgi:hypothetical protein
MFLLVPVRCSVLLGEFEFVVLEGQEVVLRAPNPSSLEKSRRLERPLAANPTL